MEPSVVGGEMLLAFLSRRRLSLPGLLPTMQHLSDALDGGMVESEARA